MDGHSRNVRRGDVVYLTAGQKHALRAAQDVHLIEVQIGSVLEEEEYQAVFLGMVRVGNTDRGVGLCTIEGLSVVAENGKEQMGN